jgi:ABC-type glutathione transport system ATPase component
VRYICDRTYVMYQGETIESGTTEAILDSPEHPYTRRLIEAASEMDLAAGSAHSRAPVKAAGRAGEKLLSVQGLQKTYTLPRSSLFGPRREFHALESVDLEIEPGESVAVIGESGSGKSTLGNIVLKTKTPSGGSVSVDGRDIAHLRGPELKRFRSRVQTIFQNPYSSLNPVKTIEHTLTQPFLTHAVCGAREARERARDMLEAVDLPRSYMSKYPHQLSGGERQRVAIARAMALKPKLVIADEPVSALDMSIRGQILNLLDSFRVDDGVSFLLITHDLADAARLTDRVIVLYRGSIVETGPTKEVLHNPQHPYTRTLVAATLPVSAARSEEAGDDDMTP